MNVSDVYLYHVFKVTAMRIYGKPVQTPFLWNQALKMTFRLEMKHLGIGLIIVSSNNDLRLTLTYFKARSNLVSYILYWENEFDPFL